MFPVAFDLSLNACKAFNVNTVYWSLIHSPPNLILHRRNKADKIREYDISFFIINVRCSEWAVSERCRMSREIKGTYKKDRNNNNKNIF